MDSESEAEVHKTDFAKVSRLRMIDRSILFFSWNNGVIYQ